MNLNDRDRQDKILYRREYGSGLERAVDLGVSAELSVRQGGPAKPEA